MIASFAFIVYLGHVPLVLLVLSLQVGGVGRGSDGGPAAEGWRVGILRMGTTATPSEWQGRRKQAPLALLALGLQGRANTRRGQCLNPAGP
jgi:hypothetical protein